MSTLLEEPAPETIAPATRRAETLAASVVILLIMTLAQRLIGFGRGILFCRWLDPEQIGQWDMAFGFLTLAAPLAVLGLPGSFGRYVEYFRQRQQFHAFLKRTTLVSGLMCVVATAVIIFARGWFSELIFGSRDESHLVVWVALCLATVILHNFLIALFIALRMYRVVTSLQFMQGVGFAMLSLGLVWMWPGSAASIVIGYGAATILSAIGAMTCLRRLAADEPTSRAAAPHSAFWAKLMPFAAWMWVTNLLANLFDLIDRYMIVHHSGMDPVEALRQVGNYHTSRVVPLLFVGIAGLLGSMITPHLSCDWEAGRREAVVRRLNMVLKLLLFSLFTVSIAVLFVAPWLFEIAFQNKFPNGLVVLPWTLAYCAWFGTIGVAQNYLWCAERPGLNSLAMLAGLLLNIGFNLFLLPRFGLEGAVWATTVANLATLALVYLFSSWHGMHVDLGTWILSLTPIALSLGPWGALAVFVGVSLLSIGTTYVLDRQEKQHLVDASLHCLQIVRTRLRRPGGIAEVA